MKRTISLILILLILTGLFTGCRIKEPDDYPDITEESTSGEITSGFYPETTTKEIDTKYNMPENNTEKTSDNKQNDLPTGTDVSPIIEARTLPENSGNSFGGKTETEVRAKTQNTEPKNEIAEKQSEIWADMKGKDNEEIDMNKLIAFSFDDGPGTNTTKRILNVLEDNGCTATFFVVGSNINNNNIPNMQRAVEIGCEIGNHTWSHDIQLNQKSMSTIENEISRTSDRIEEAVGIRPVLMRPPGGNCSTLKGNTDLPIINWSVDTNDWRKKGNAGNAAAARELADYIINEVNGNPGSIVLMHDIYQFTAETVELVIPELCSRGYTIVSVSQLAKLMGTSLNAGQVYYSIKRTVYVEPGKYIVNTKSDPLTLRSTPNGNSIAKIAKGTELEVIKCENGWAYVRCEGYTGWVNPVYLKKCAT